MLRTVNPHGQFDAAIGAGGLALQAKLAAVLVMIVYQAVFGHRRAPLPVYANMAPALIVLACS